MIASNVIGFIMIFILFSYPFVKIWREDSFLEAVTVYAQTLSVIAFVFTAIYLADL